MFSCLFSYILLWIKCATLQTVLGPLYMVDIFMLSSNIQTQTGQKALCTHWHNPSSNMSWVWTDGQRMIRSMAATNQSIRLLDSQWQTTYINRIKCVCAIKLLVLTLFYIAGRSVSVDTNCFMFFCGKGHFTQNRQCCKFVQIVI